MTRFLRTGGLMLVALALMVALAIADGPPPKDAGVSPRPEARASQIAPVESGLRPVTDCTRRHQAFEDRLRPRREPQPTCR